MSDSPLKQNITEAMKDAMRAKDKPRLGTIRLALAEIKRIEVDERIDLDDARVIGVLDKMVKQRRESIKQFEAADRMELAEVEKQEINVLQQFLPGALSESELEAIIKAAVTEIGAESMKDMGKVMGGVMGKLKPTGKMVDGALVQKLVKEALGA